MFVAPRVWVWAIIVIAVTVPCRKLPKSWAPECRAGKIFGDRWRGVDNAVGGTEGSQDASAGVNSLTCNEPQDAIQKPKSRRRFGATLGHTTGEVFFFLASHAAAVR